MEPLFSKRISADISDNPVRIRGLPQGYMASWPMSKLELYKEYLVIKILWRIFKIYYKNIDYIKKEMFGIRIFHSQESINHFVRISGLGFHRKMLAKMKNIAKENKLPLKIIS